MTGIYSPVATGFLQKIIPAAFARQDLRDWFVSETRHEVAYLGSRSLHKEQAVRRVQMKGPFYTNYWWGERVIGACRPAGSVACEIDALIFLQSSAGQVLAIHIEHKRRGEAFKLGQAEAYPMRAAHFCKPNYCPAQLLPHHDWLTLVFCDEVEIGSETLQPFERQISHSAVADFLKRSADA